MDLLPRDLNGLGLYMDIIVVRDMAGTRNVSIKKSLMMTLGGEGKGAISEHTNMYLQKSISKHVDLFLVL